MGYFSNRAMDFEDNHEDYSSSSPDRQLMWRLEDLRNRHKELEKSGALYRNKEDGLRLTENDIRYIIPECFEYIADVEQAIDLAISDLRFKYNIDVVDEAIDDEQVIYDIPFIGQLYSDEVELAETYNKPMKAA